MNSTRQGLVGRSNISAGQCEDCAVAFLFGCQVGNAISDHFRKPLSLSQAAQLAFAFTSSPGRVRKPLSHSKSFMVAFASSPARFRFRKSTCGRFRRHFRGRFCQVAQLAFTFESIQGRFRMQLSLLSRAVQLAFAFTSEQPQPLSQAAPVAL